MPRRASLEGRLFEGTVIADRYRVDRLIAEGGMGLVFRGRHLMLDQPIALKIVRPSFAHHPVAVARFLDEARAIARLKSPHVAQVFDSGTVDDGPPYMVLELLDGWDLRSLLEGEGRLSCERAAEYVMQACRAVSEAHALGIIHRDLKPENLFLHRGNDGTPIIKVLDFGISKRLNPREGRSYTVEGETLGSPHYMAPEQMSAAKLDERVDIWALGVVLFELVTGRVPYQGDNIAQVCAALLSEEAPPISRVRSDVPAGFQNVVARCLKKNPAERYSHVDELGEALRCYLTGQAAVSSVPAPHGKSALASDTGTLISMAPPSTGRSPRSETQGGRSGLFLPSAAGVLAACVALAAVLGTKNWLPATVSDAIPLSAAASLRGPDEVSAETAKPSQSERTAIENAVVLRPAWDHFVEPATLDATPRVKSMAEPVVQPVTPALPVRPVVVPATTRVAPRLPNEATSIRRENQAPPESRSSPVTASDVAFRDPLQPIVPVQPAKAQGKSEDLDELIPPYEAPPGESGAESNDGASKQYF